MPCPLSLIGYREGEEAEQRWRLGAANPLPPNLFKLKVILTDCHREWKAGEGGDSLAREIYFQWTSKGLDIPFPTANTPPELHP